MSFLLPYQFQSNLKLIGLIVILLVAFMNRGKMTEYFSSVILPQDDYTVQENRKQIQANKIAHLAPATEVPTYAPAAPTVEHFAIPDSDL